jgi:hypothetical protein
MSGTSSAGRFGQRINYPTTTCLYFQVCATQDRKWTGAVEPTGEVVVVGPSGPGTFSSCDPVIVRFGDRFVLKIAKTWMGFIFVDLADSVVYLTPDEEQPTSYEFVNTNFSCFWAMWPSLFDGSPIDFERLKEIDPNPLLEGSMWEFIAEERTNGLF